jgi:hypothetical protein
VCNSLFPCHHHLFPRTIYQVYILSSNSSFRLMYTREFRNLIRWCCCRIILLQLANEIEMIANCIRIIFDNIFLFILVPFFSYCEEFTTKQSNELKVTSLSQRDAYGRRLIRNDTIFLFYQFKFIF